MKTRLKIFQTMAVALGLGTGRLLADNACVESGPYTNMIGCLQAGTFVPGVLTPTNISAVVGQMIVPPTASGYSITNGQVLYYVTNDCPDTGPNYYFTNGIHYTFGSPYFVPTVPTIFWTPGIYTYTDMVVATGSPCSPLTNALGTVTINIATNTPDVLLDVDFGGASHGSKTGYAAIGDSSTDVWNYYSKTNSASGALTNLLTATGLVSPVGLLVTNLPTAGTNGSSDAMYNDYLFTNSAAATLTFTNLPGGTWDLYLYSQDGNFTLSVGGTNYGTQICHDGSPSSAPLAWQQGVQYVAFLNVVVTNGQPVRVTINPGTNGAALISGLQIASAFHIPPSGVPLGLAAWWPADGNAKEMIGGTTGVVNTGTTYVPGMVNQAFNFDGVTGCVMNTNVPPMTNIQNTFTIEFWVYPQMGITLPLQNNSGYPGVSGQSYAVFPDYGGTGGPVGAGMSVGTNGIAIIEHGDSYMPSMLSYSNPLSGWIHVALVYTNKQPVLYVNGVNVKTGITSTRTFVYPSKNFGGSTISPWNGYGPYKGSLDEIHIYNRALSATEIAAIYDDGSNGETLNPMQDSDYDGVSDAQELVDRTNPNDPNSVLHIRLGYWRFDNTNTWVGDAGQLPLLATNVVGVPSWDTNAVLIDSTNAAILKYRDVETNGDANINLRSGTVCFWFKPDWSSVDQGGTGPGSYGRLIEMGNNNPVYSTNSWIVYLTNGWWSLYFSADGNQVAFGSSTNGFGGIKLTTPISLVSNQWYQIVLTYAPTNSLLYLNGQEVTNGLGAAYFPNLAERTNGFTIGSSASGMNQARGAFDDLATFNYALNASVISSNYLAAINQDTTGDGLADYWVWEYFGTLAVDPNSSPDGNGQSLLYDYENGIDPLDYYNGNLPNMTIVGGYNQTGLTNSWLAMPLTVQLQGTNAAILTNAPLTFTVTKGSALIAVTSNGVTSSSIQLRTGTNGQAAVWLQLPFVTSGNIVTVYAQSGTNVTQVSFYEVAVTPTEASQVGIGGERIMELNASGNVVSWGGNQYGELGDYTYLDSTNAVHVVGLTNLTIIASGWTHSLAVDSNGALWAWGDDESGNQRTWQLGIGDIGETNRPVQVLGMTNSVIAIAGGQQYSVAIKADGTVWAWGTLEVGGSDTLRQQIPVLIEGPTNAVAASVGDEHALIVLADGTVWAWGNDAYGQLGDGVIGVGSDIPVQVSGLSNVLAVCAGDNHSLALDANGRVWAWGLDDSGQLGDGGSEVAYALPVLVFTNVAQIAAGANHSLALDVDGRLWAWGANNAEQLGTNGFSQTNLPMQVLEFTNVISIAAGSDASTALDGSSNLWQWGASDSDGTNWVWSNENGLPTLAPRYVDFYNGQLPNLTILNGNNQVTYGSLGFDQPLVFQVTDTNGLVLSHAPVSVEIIAGDMELQTQTNGSFYQGLRLTTDTNGEVSLIGYADYNVVNTNCLIRVLAASHEKVQEVDFTETVIPAVFPTLTFTSPTNGGTFLVGTNRPLNITVDAEIASGSIQEVDYFYQTNGGAQTFLGISTLSPFSLAWTNAMWLTNAFVGQYILSAMAISTTEVSSDTNSVSFTVALDSDGNGLPDYWQLQYFGHLGLDPNSSPDGNGQSLLYDYQNGFDPMDYYDGNLPNLEIMGNYQAGNYNSFLPLPVVIQVADDNLDPLTNAPLVLTVTNGTALLATNTADTPASTLTLRTDSNGVATVLVYFPLASTNPPDSTIFVSAYSGTNSVTTNVDEYVLLGHWTFNDTNTWVGESGQLPMLATNLAGVPSWSSNAVLIDSASPASLAYRVVETNGGVNINCQTGSLLFYFKPDWSSANQGGTGPGSSGRLIEMGNCGPSSPTNSDIIYFITGWWSLYLSPDGTQLSFGTSTNGGGMTNLSASISWTSNTWYQIALAYSTTNSALFVDGQLLTIGAGVIYLPSADDLTNGFSIGSDQAGNSQARGTFEELETFGSPLAGIGTPVDTYWYGIPDYQADPNGLLGAWETKYFGLLGVNPNGYYDNDGTNNLQAFLDGIDPNIISFSFSFPNQYVSTNIVNGVITVLGGVPSYFALLVDNTNIAGATWTAYTASNLTVNLGTNQGSHDVLVGLRGLPLDAQQTWEDTTLVLGTNLPNISITNPVNNVSFNSSRVDVSGNFTDTSVQQITVNGTIAFINGTNFEVLNVPLNAGTNVITAIIEDLNGSTNTASIEIIGTTNTDGSMNNPVQLQATPVAGFAPLSVAFSMQTDFPGTVQQVCYDFNGDDIADFITNGLGSITNNYVTNGEYFPVVTIQTTAGRFSSIGGWNAVALDPSNPPVQINVQAPATAATFASITDPVDLKWVAPSNLYVLSGSAATVTEFSTNGSIIRSLTNLGINPSGFDVDAAGNVYVAVTSSNQVWKFNQTTSSFAADTTFGNGGYVGNGDGSSGTNAGEFNAPFDVAVSPDGGTLSVSDSGNNYIQQFDSSGNFLHSFGAQGNAVGQFNTPEGLTYDSDDILYIVDSGNNRIAVAQDSEVEGVSGMNGTALGQFSSPVNINVDERGVYVADAGNNRIQSFELLANATYSFTPSDIRFAVSTNLNAPAAVAAVDNLTNETFYVADTGNNRVLLYTLPADDPTPAWTSMTAHVAAGDISDAVSSFCSASEDGYRQAFLDIGPAGVISDINQIGPLTPVFIKNDTAEYYFEQTIDGQLLLFPVEFVKENGVWKILEF